MEIEKFTTKSYDLIKDKLENEFDDFWNKEQLKQELFNDNSYFIIARDYNEIVGFAGILINIDYNEVLNIVVRKDERRNGIGRALLEELIKITKKQNKSKLILEVNEKNIAAIKLYEKIGFVRVGTRPNYYNGNEDCILMDLNLKNDF